MNRETGTALDTSPAATPLAESTTLAFESAAKRLALSPEGLAAACANGEIADIIIELRLARFHLNEADQERVEALLRNMGVLP